MRINVRVEGVEETLAQLEGLSDRMKAAAASGVLAGAEAVAGEAKALAPEDEGHLRNSITVQIGGGQSGVTATVIATAAHAGYVEFGTGPRGNESHAGIAPVDVTYRPDGWVYRDEQGNYHYTEGQPARPYLYPAFQAAKGRVQKIIAERVQAAMGGG